MTERDERFDGVVLDDEFVRGAGVRERTAEQRRADLAWARADLALHAEQANAARVRRRRNRISLIGCMGLLGGIALLSIEQAGATEDVVSGVVRASVPDLPPTYGARRAPALIPAPTTAEHRYLHLRSDGRPVGYDPCRPIEMP